MESTDGCLRRHDQDDPMARVDRRRPREYLRYVHRLHHVNHRLRPGKEKFCQVSTLHTSTPFTPVGIAVLL